MKRAMIAAMAFFLAAGCGKSGDGSKDQTKGASTAPASDPATKPFAWAKSYAGIYTSTWGDTVFTQNGEDVNATYPGGSLSCKVERSVLNCTWKEGEAFGQARLMRQLDDKIEGTWGNGTDNAGGGEWSFTPKKEP